MGRKVGIDVVAKLLDGPPLFFGVGLGDSGRLPHARDRHFVRELDFALVDLTCNRRCGRRLRRAGEWQMTLAGEQPGRRVETDPAGARQIHLRPGVQIGEILFRSRRAIDRLHVGRQLNQVAGDEARAESEMAQELHQQPSRVTALARVLG